mmetsp:Transcript_30728/g.77411  ORF Transcript_30728/g.77411 Transcript_30728/m.77411 type:complete len:382 (-) Transcript_30728:6-1151(-)
MPEVIKQEEPVQPNSLSGAWRTTMALMETFRDRPAPTFAFLTALASWGAAFSRLCWPRFADPEEAGVCLLRDVLVAPYPGEWRRYVLHPLWPLEPGYIRAFFASAVLLLEGYTLEYEVGTSQFTGALVGLHVVAAAVLLHFGFVACHLSLEAVLVALAVVMHQVNPKVHTDGLDKSMRVPFAIEPRWHVWFLQSILLLMTSDFPKALVVHGAGLAVGGALALRDPQVWIDAWNAARARSFGIGATVHIALLLFTLLFMPLTTQSLPGDFFAALLDGRVLSRAWWQTSSPGSPALLHLALAGLMSSEALFICKLIISFAFPLLLTPFRMWTKFYTGACVLLCMYAMNSPVWRYPHVGFLVLMYLAWALWKLPGLEPAKQHSA